MRKNSVAVVFLFALVLGLTFGLSQAQEVNEQAGELSQAPQNVIFFDNFAKASSTWQPISGKWVIKDGGYYQEDNAAGAYQYSVTNIKLSEGTIEVSATPLKATQYARGGCFGIMMKYIDAGNWCAIRLGDYELACQIASVAREVKGSEDPKKIVHFTTFTPVLNQKYKLTVTIKGDKVAVFLDDVFLGMVEGMMPFAGEKGRVGLWAGSNVCFDDFKIMESK